MNIKEKLPSMTEKEVIDLLFTNGNLIKHPFVTASSAQIISFKKEEWLKKKIVILI